MASPTDQSPSTRAVPASKLRNLAHAVLVSHGTPASAADLVSDNLVSADMRGTSSHGVMRLPSYIARVRAGVLSPSSIPVLRNVTGCCASVDGQNTFGAVVAATAMDAAIERARTHGLGLVCARNSNHFGASAWTVRRGVDAGLAVLVFTNSSPALPPFGAREKLLGVSPLACGAPCRPPNRNDGDTYKGADAFILDMAPSVAARGKIHAAARRNEAIPEGWALDASGQATTDAAAALAGVMLPMGGAKGSGLAMTMDVFAGVLSGSAFGGDVTGPYDPSAAADVGHFILAIRPDLFVSLDEFYERMQTLYARVTGAERAAGVERIYFPGEIEAELEIARARDCVPLTSGEIDTLNDEARAAGVAAELLL